MWTKEERGRYLLAALDHVENAVECLNNASRCGVPANGQVFNLLENAKELLKDIRNVVD